MLSVVMAPHAPSTLHGVGVVFSLEGGDMVVIRRRMVQVLSWARDYFWPFRVFALFVCAMSAIYSIALFPLILLSDTGVRWKYPLFPYVCFGYGLAVGLRFQQKWAGVVFAVICCSLAFEVGVLGSWVTPGPWRLMNIGAGIFLALPALEVWGNWKKLR